MRPPFDPADRLWHILAEDAADLPSKAADQARKSRALEATRRRQVVIAVAVLFCSAGVWQLLPRHHVDEQSVTVPTPAESLIALPEPASPERSVEPLAPDLEPSPPSSPLPRDATIVQTPGRAINDPFPLPEGLTQEQVSVVQAAQGLPLLLVRDTTGSVARIHVIER